MVVRDNKVTKCPTTMCASTNPKTRTPSALAHDHNRVLKEGSGDTAVLAPSHTAVRRRRPVDVEGLAQSFGETHGAVRRWCGRRKARSSGFEKMPPTAGRGVKSYE